MHDEPPNLPAVPDDAALAGVVIDGEVVGGAPSPGRLIPAPVRAAVSRTRGGAAARHAGYVAAGVVVAGRRWHQRRTRHERTLRALEAGGNHEAMLAWRQQAEAERQARHARRKAAAEAAILVARSIHWILAAGVALMAVAGLLTALSMDSLAGFAVPWIEAAHAYAAVSAAAGTVITAAGYVIPSGIVLGLWHLGRTGGSLAPGWSVAARPEDQDRALVITADTIVLAVQHLPITPLGKAFKDGWQPVFDPPPVRDGRGYQAAFSLPLGVTAEMIADQRPVLARNLHREPNEVWPSAGAPGYASVYVLDRGAMDARAPEYPLLHEGQADVFEGVPGGVVGRGDEALIPVVGNNGVLGGLMGQGKSNGARVFMLGCATDPLARLSVFTFANNGDFDAYAPRLEVYRKGLDDDVIEAAVAHLEELYEDVGRREQALADLGAKKVTRALAMRYPELRPRVTLLSECHELFGHPEYGERAGELAVKTVKRARKTAEVLWFDTQSSRKGAIPPALVELVAVNCCFAVKSWRSNDGFLGDGSFAAGIRATELRPGRDKGTSLVTGISDAQFELLKWYFIEVNDDTGYDAAAEVIARCVRDLAPGTPVGASMPAAAIESRDLLADLGQVLGGERVKLRDAVALLRQLAPGWGRYRAMTATQLREDLAAEGVKTVNVSGTFHLDPPELRRVISDREREGE